MYCAIVKKDKSITWKYDKANLTKIFGGTKKQAKVIPYSHYHGNIVRVAQFVYKVNFNYDYEIAIAEANLEEKDLTFLRLKLSDRILFELNTEALELITEDEIKALWENIYPFSPLFSNHKEVIELGNEIKKLTEEQQRLHEKQEQLHLKINEKRKILQEELRLSLLDKLNKKQ
jgi:hypothetical protein